MKNEIYTKITKLSLAVLLNTQNHDSLMGFPKIITT